MTTVNRKALADALAWVSGALMTRPSVPILAGIRVVADEGEASVSAFDYETSMRASLDAEGLDTLDVVAPGIMLRDLVAAMNGDTVTLTATDDGRLAVSDGRASYTLATLHREDFPALPEPPATHGRIDAGVLLEAVRAVATATDRQSKSSQPHDSIMLGVNTYSLTLSASESKLAAFRTVEWNGGARDGLMVVPAMEMLDALKGLSGEVEIGTDDHVIAMTDAQRSVVIRLGAKQPMDLWRMLRTAHTVTVEVESDALTAAAKRALMVMGSHDVPRIRLEIGAEQIAVTVLSSEHTGTETVDAKSDGELSIVVNARAFTAALAPYAGTVAIGLAGARKNLQIGPAGVAPDLACHLLAPMLDPGARP